MQKSTDEEKKAEEECYTVKQKAIDISSVEMCDEEVEHLFQEIEDYKKSLGQAERQMKSST